jgi:hypothetical protein
MTVRAAALSTVASRTGVLNSKLYRGCQTESSPAKAISRDELNADRRPITWETGALVKLSAL